MTRMAPKTVKGVPVYQSGEPMVYKGETFITLVPENDDDNRIWEFSLTTGKLIQTKA